MASSPTVRQMSRSCGRDGRDLCLGGTQETELPMPPEVGVGGMEVKAACWAVCICVCVTPGCLVGDGSSHIPGEGCAWRCPSHL